MRKTSKPITPAFVLAQDKAEKFFDTKANTVDDFLNSISEKRNRLKKN